MKYRERESVLVFGDKLRAEGMKTNMTFEVLLAFFMKEIPQALASTANCW